MDSTLLLEKLIKIECSIGAVDAITLRGMVMDAEECLLRLQYEIAKDLQADAGQIRQSKLDLIH